MGIPYIAFGNLRKGILWLLPSIIITIISIVAVTVAIWDMIKMNKEKRKDDRFFTQISGITKRNSGFETKLDAMNGYEFEQFVAKLFSNMGYSTEVTKKSGDQGVDVIAKSDFQTLAIQAKNHTSIISNSAIQEIVAAKVPSKADKAVVVATSDFTKSAKDLARANKVKLVNRKELLNLIDKFI